MPKTKSQRVREWEEWQCRLRELTPKTPGHLIVTIHFLKHHEGHMKVAKVQVTWPAATDENTKSYVLTTTVAGQPPTQQIIDGKETQFTGNFQIGNVVTFSLVAKNGPIPSPGASEVTFNVEDIPAPATPGALSVATVGFEDVPG